MDPGGLGAWPPNGSAFYSKQWCLEIFTRKVQLSPPPKSSSVSTPETYQFDHRTLLVIVLSLQHLNTDTKTLPLAIFFYSLGRRKESRARGADRSKRAPTTLGQQMYPRNGGHPRHFLGNIMGYASDSHINYCLFQSNIACF